MASFFGNITTIVTSLILLGAILYFIGPSWIPALPQGPPGPGNVDAAKNPDVAGNPGKAQELNTEKQALAFARAKQRQAASLGDDTLRSLDECLDEVQQYDALAKPLLSNETGKKIAGDPSLLKRFRLVHGKERPNPSKLEQYRHDVLEMVSPIKASLKSGTDGTMPPSGVAGEFERIQGEVKTQRDTWRKDRILIEVIAAEAKRTDAKPAEKSLQETIRATEQAEVAAFAEAMEKEANKAKAEMEAKAIQAKADGIRAIEQAKIDKALAEKRTEAERIRTEAFLKEAKEKAEGEAAKAKVEKERLVKKVLDPKTKQTLAPILAKTIFQPVIVDGKVKNDHVGGLMDRISYTRLKSVGALDQSREGLAALAAVGCYVNRHPHWLFSPIPAEWTEGNRALLEEAQALLRELGPTLVEEKLLAP
jgi:regulator of protease activity HflC (stomatin/prohibitin superfamily)